MIFAWHFFQIMIVLPGQIIVVYITCHLCVLFLISKHFWPLFAGLNASDPFDHHLNYWLLHSSNRPHRHFSFLSSHCLDDEIKMFRLISCNVTDLKLLSTKSCFVLHVQLEYGKMAFRWIQMLACSLFYCLFFHWTGDAGRPSHTHINDMMLLTQGGPCKVGPCTLGAGHLASNRRLSATPMEDDQDRLRLCQQFDV